MRGDLLAHVAGCVVDGRQIVAGRSELDGSDDRPASCPFRIAGKPHPGGTGRKGCPCWHRGDRVCSGSQSTEAT